MHLIGYILSGNNTCLKYRAFLLGVNIQYCLNILILFFGGGEIALCILFPMSNEKDERKNLRIYKNTCEMHITKILF